MSIDELLNIVDYGISFYSDDHLGNRFTVLEYYALTDVEPLNLKKVALAKNRRSTALKLQIFDEKNLWNYSNVDMNSRLRLEHSIRGRELTIEDKILIKDFIEKEGYPLIDGVFDMVARHYVELGIESASKENISSKVIATYNNAENKVKDTKSKVYQKHLKVR